MKQYFKSLHYGVATTCATCANEHTKERLSRDERVQRAITAVVADGVIREKRDFAIIHRYLVDTIIWEHLSFVSFAEFLQKKCHIQSQLLPSSSSLSKVVIRGTYPNWIFTDVKDNVADRFWLIVKTFQTYWFKM